MDIVKESREFALSEIEKFGLPDMVHFEISEGKALLLAEKLSADKTIVLAGIYLMDLKLGQSFQDNNISEHVEMSAQATKEFLTKFDIDEISKEKILHCVKAHHGTIPFECIEAEICANADCYRFIHPKGFFVFLTILGKRGLNFYECIAEAEKKIDEKYRIVSLDLCKQELEEYYVTLKRYISDARNT